MSFPKAFTTRLYPHLPCRSGNHVGVKVGRVSLAELGVKLCDDSHLLDDSMSYSIAVYQRHIVQLQGRGHRALPGSNASSKADDFHVVVCFPMVSETLGYSFLSDSDPRDE